jgi:hypothetical protein
MWRDISFVIVEQMAYNSVKTLTWDRRAGADTVTITRNEILTGINSPEQFILALVEVEDGEAREPRYVREPFGAEPDFGVTSANYDLRELLSASFKGGKRC